MECQSRVWEQVKSKVTTMSLKREARIFNSTMITESIDREHRDSRGDKALAMNQARLSWKFTDEGTQPFTARND